MFGYFHRYFVRYLASNDDSYLSGSLPSNESGSVPRSLPSYSPLSRPSSFPEYSTDNLGTNVWSFLERNCEGPGARGGPAQPEAVTYLVMDEKYLAIAVS